MSLKTRFFRAKRTVQEHLKSRLEVTASIGLKTLSQIKIWASCDGVRHLNARKDLFETMIPKGRVGAELGVHKGGLSRWILRHNRPKELHLIDPWWNQPFENWAWSTGDQSPASSGAAIIHAFSDEIQRGDVRIHAGYDTDVLARFPDEYFDWVYLDTTHKYEDTREEMALLLRKVKEKGVIAGDDWYENESHSHHGVCRAVREVLSQDPTVSLAYCKNHQWALTRTPEVRPKGETSSSTNERPLQVA